MSKRKETGGSSTVQNFYDDVAGIYFKMIDFEKNLRIRENAYKKIFPKIGRGADIGCGIGLDSIALAKNGHKVSAFDISENMIKEAEQNAIKYKVGFDAKVSGFNDLRVNNKLKYDFVLSVGNTIAHLKRNQLRSAIKKVYSLLLPGGKIFLHILNYDLIIGQSRKINNIANRSGQIIVRFYEFKKGELDFNILSFPVNESRNFKLFTTRHYPHSKKTINDFMKQAGFHKIKFTGTFEGAEFDLRSSKDLFIEAVKKL